MTPSDRILNLANPSESGSSLPGLIQGSAGAGATNSSRINALLNEALTNSTSTAKRIYCPIGLYEFANPIVTPTASSFRIEGGGGIPKGLADLRGGTGNNGCFTIWRWVGGSTGPLLQIGNSNGINFSGICLDGANSHGGPFSGETNLQDLVIFDADVGGFFHNFHDMGFFRARRLFFCRESGSNGPAEIRFNNVVWNCGEEDFGQWDSIAFRAEENQTVNCSFNQNLFNNCPICVSVGGPPGANEFAGRVTITDATTANCGLMLEVDSSRQNTNGYKIDGVHVDMLYGSSPSSTSFRLFHQKNVDGMSTGGHVRLQNIKFGGITNIAQHTSEFIPCTPSPIANDGASLNGGSYIGNTIQLGYKLNVKVGDRIGFVDEFNRDVFLGETTVTAHNSHRNYTVQTALGSMPFAVQQSYTNNTLRAIHGEAMITCNGSDQVTICDTTFNSFRLQGQRLARMTSTTYQGGRNPVVRVVDCDGFQANGFSAAALEQTLRRSGTTYFLFENVSSLGVQSIPIIHGNYGVGLLEGGGGNGGGGDNKPSLENEMNILAKYAQTRAIQLVLRDPTTGDPKPGIAFASADVIISKDGASPVTLGSVPAGSGSGIYLLLVSGTHTTASQAKIVIKDQTTPAAFLPLVIHLETYGNANAQHEMDFDTPTMNLPDGGLTVNKIADNAITAAKIADNTLTTNKFASQPITVPPVGATSARLPELVGLGALQVANPRTNGTLFEARRPDGAVLRSYTLNDATNPTEKVESS